VFDQISARLSSLDSRPAQDQRNVKPLVVKELLPPGVADAVVGQKDHHGLVEYLFLLEPFQDIPHLHVGVTNGVQVGGPVVQQDWIAWIIGRKPDFLGFGQRPKRSPSCRLPVAPLAVLTAVEFDLREKWLSRFPSCPVVAVVQILTFPLEVVVRFAQSIPLDLG
jgi:hypothetical protein